MMKQDVFFVKEFSDVFTIGKLTGEPNEDGEQDYIGYSSTRSSLSYEVEEDFLSEEELKSLRSNNYPSTPMVTTRERFLKVECLHDYLLAIFMYYNLGAGPNGLLTVEALDGIPESTPDRDQVINKVKSLFEKIYNTISSK